MAKKNRNKTAAAATYPGVLSLAGKGKEPLRLACEHCDWTSVADGEDPLYLHIVLECPVTNSDILLAAKVRYEARYGRTLRSIIPPDSEEEAPEPVTYQPRRNKRAGGMKPVMKVGSTSKNDDESLDQLLAQMMIETKTPVSLMTRPEWIHFFRLLRPTYQMPSPERLAGLMEIERQKM